MQHVQYDQIRALRLLSDAELIETKRTLRYLWDPQTQYGHPNPAFACHVPGAAAITTRGCHNLIDPIGNGRLGPRRRPSRLPLTLFATEPNLSPNR